MQLTKPLRSLARAAATLFVCSSLTALAANPRWVTGPPYFSTSGQPVIWYTDSPKYFTDPGDLSTYVNHAAADALVAAAASVWNIPTSRLTLSQGGTLAEHVSSTNTYVGPTGIVFPADVQPTNSAAIQIAIIYDRDGSITDLLLGAGASDPSGCRDSAVTESVDSITSDGFIRHAILILNGRCTGSAAAMQTQMQYQLMRAFGRILGLGWSQANDNVFTYSPAPTSQQALHWPLMHPIDILCGPYSYQCLPQPFTPRMDDISSMALLYYIPQGTAAPGKTDSLLNANRISGRLSFPNGQGMQGANVIARRLGQYLPVGNTEQWDSVSSVSGFLYRQTNANTITGPNNSQAASMGTLYNYYEGWYEFSRVDIVAGDWQNLVVTTEPVNPLYTGPYSVGPYVANTVQPSGTNISTIIGIFPSYANYGWFDLPAPSGSGSTCSGSGGAESSPQSLNSTGLWQGQLCGYGWTSWSSLTVQANRSFTVEVTAQDEQGFTSSMKSMPVIGVWRGSDALGTTPTVASVTEGLNTASAGLTSLTVNAPPAGALRFAIADERGDGRPDYNFGARVLYADSISPTNLPAAGGLVTITGMGFRPGNTVTVNGLPATVQSWSANAIVATVPASGSHSALKADVVIHDISTGGTATMLQALTYAAPPPETMQLISAPSGSLTTGTPTTTPFTVKIVAADGVTPVSGETITFTASTSGGAATALFNCGVATCTATTDATGTATTAVTPVLAGTITITATSAAGSSVFTSFSATDPSPPQITLISSPSGIVYVGDVAANPLSIRILKGDGVTPLSGATITVTTTGTVSFGACPTTPCVFTTDANGIASTTVIPLAPGAITLTATATAGSVTSAFTAVARVRTITLSTPTLYLAANATTSFAQQAILSDNSASVANLPINWTSATALTPASPTSTTNASGVATINIAAGPLSATTETQGTACAWSNTICAPFNIQSIDPAALQLQIISGANQSLPASGTLGNLLLRVSDTAGHPVAGATVFVYQTLEPGAACPTRGRCPAQPIERQSQSTAISDANGLVTITPLDQAASTEITNIVATAGTQGFVSLSLTKGW